MSIRTIHTVALIGAPNTGKSDFLGRVKIGNLVENRIIHVESAATEVYCKIYEASSDLITYDSTILIPEIQNASAAIVFLRPGMNFKDPIIDAVRNTLPEQLIVLCRCFSDVRETSPYGGLLPAVFQGLACFNLPSADYNPNIILLHILRILSGQPTLWSDYTLRKGTSQLINDDQV